MGAVRWLEKANGARFPQHVDGDNTRVTPGDMDVQPSPFDPEKTHKITGKTDASLMRWGAKTTSSEASTWVSDSGTWYYLDAHVGAMVAGTHSVDGRCSTFSPSGRWLGYAS